MKIYFFRDSVIQCACCGTMLLPIRGREIRNEDGAFIYYYKCEFPNCRQRGRLFRIDPIVVESIQTI